MARTGNRLKLSRSLLYEQLADHLRALIEEQKLWGKNLPPERELARSYEVSQETVRKGLRLLVREGVIVRRQGQGTRVLAKRPRGRARTGTRVLLGSRWGSTIGGYAGRIMVGLGTGVGEIGVSLKIGDLSAPGGSEAFLATVGREDPDGLVLLTVSDRELVQELLRIRNTPLVVVDHHFAGLPVTSVRDDSRGGARQACEHLLELGHRRIGYVDMTEGELNPWRYEGYGEALRAAGIEPDPGLRVRCASSVEEGRAATERLLALAEPPTAVLAFDHKRAMGAWLAGKARGTFAVVGFDGEGNPPGLPGELTTVHVDAREMGRVAIRELSELMAGKTRPGREVLVPAEMVIGDSSRPARG